MIQALRNTKIVLSLFKIITLWVTNILLLEVNTQAAKMFPDSYTMAFNLPVGIIISGLLVYQV
ncbi:MAG: hypothetical protein DRJ10_05690, partial [Bacteroidetes bacterium]